MNYLATLIESRDVSVLDLGAKPPGEAIDVAGEGLRVVAHVAGADAIDQRAVYAYAQRLRAIRAELADAEAGFDFRRREELENEEAALRDQLFEARRVESSDLRRARDAVAKALKDAIRRIAEVHPELAAHLRTAVKTGNTIKYRP